MAQANLDPLDHFIDHGGREGRDPSPRFDSTEYLCTYPEVAVSGQNPLVHYLASRGSRGLEDANPRIVPVAGVNSLRTNSPLRLGVVIHAFYEDVLDELLEASLNVPGFFNLYVAAKNSEIEDRAKAFASKHSNRLRLVVDHPTNAGRNVSTLTSLFGPRILNECDLICHLHTKKSLHLRDGQSQWRKSLVANLLGDAGYTERIVSAFQEDPDLGVLTPAPYKSIPHWAFTKGENSPFLEWVATKLEITSLDAEYFPYPVGCMFWARTRAIRQLVDGRIGYQDYPPEQGQIDGTIAHAIERVIIHLAQQNGFSFIEGDFERGTFRLKASTLNFNLHRRLVTSPRVENEIMNHDVISFSLFQAVLTDQVSSRSSASSSLGSPVFLRSRVAELMAFAKSLGKRVIVLTDVEAQRDRLPPDLKYIDNAYMLSEIGLRKDDGSLWPFLLEREEVSKDRFLHLGDHSLLDIHIPKTLGYHAVHLISPRGLYEIHSILRGEFKIPLAEPADLNVAEEFNDPLEGR